jgi:hypothetical protein
VWTPGLDGWRSNEASVAAAANGNIPAIPEAGHAAPPEYVPMENYATRQKSVNFFGQLMNRWR